jgi:DNA-binding response OmpR family regulator
MLIVSSSKDSANSLATLLRAEGHYVMTTGNYCIALELNLDFRPDIVLLDHHLEETSGYALAQSMRAQPNRENVTLVCVTEWLLEAETPVPWKEAGFSYHLQVPADEGDLEVMFGVLGIPEDPSWTEHRYSSRRILIVEHDREAAQSLAAPLRQMGNEVEIVHDGCDGLEAERSFRPDIVLVDIHLPGLDARTLARSISAHHSLRKVSLVFVYSERCEGEDWKSAMRAGFDDRMRIPADRIALQQWLVRLGVAPQSAADAANGITRLYSKGRLFRKDWFTARRFTFELLQRAATHDPADMVTAMRAIWDASAWEQSLEEFLEQMRTWLMDEPPSDPSQIGASRWGCSTDEINPNLRQDAYEGWWRWYRYFRE